MANQLDETLIYLREISRYMPQEEGWGFVCDLTCGHTVWLALEPPIAVYCGQCLEKLVSQIREIQAAQKMK